MDATVEAIEEWPGRDLFDETEESMPWTRKR
jgi:hypothetical protein